MKKFTNKLAIELMDSANDLFERRMWIRAVLAKDGVVTLHSHNASATDAGQSCLTLLTRYEQGVRTEVRHPDIPSPVPRCDHTFITVCTKCGERRES